MKNALGTVDTVLLLGGRSEIGLAITGRLVRDGARRVVLAVRGGEVAPETVLWLKAAGADLVEVLAFDAAQPETHQELFTRATACLGDIDVIVAAFGVLGDQRELVADPLAAARSTTTNFTGHVSTGLRAAGALRAQGHGTLVVLSSVAGVRVRRANLVYGAAKAGLDRFAQGLDDALHGSGARVMVVRPGFVATAMTAGLPRAPFATTAEAVAAAVADGLRLDRRQVWVPAYLKGVFAVLRVLPRSLWRRLPA